MELIGTKLKPGSQREQLAKQQINTVERIKHIMENKEELEAIFAYPMSSQSLSTVKLLLKNKEVLRALKKNAQQRIIGPLHFIS